MEDLMQTGQSAVYIERKSCPLAPVLEALRKSKADVVAHPGSNVERDVLLWFIRVGEYCHLFEARPWSLFRRSLGPRIDRLVEILDEGFKIAADEDGTTAFFDRINPTLVDPLINRKAVERENGQANEVICDMSAEGFGIEIASFVQAAYATTGPAGRRLERLTFC